MPVLAVGEGCTERDEELPELLIVVGKRVGARLFSCHSSDPGLGVSDPDGFPERRLRLLGPAIWSPDEAPRFMAACAFGLPGIDLRKDPAA